MTGKWLSVPAVLWAMDDAPDVPPELVSSLIAVARHADENGIGAYCSAATVAAITRKTERQAKRDLDRLEKLGLTLPGDSRLVKDIRADRRPKVRDLPMPRGDTYDTPLDANGVTPRVERGDIQGPHGVSPMSPEQSFNKPRTGVRGANGASAPRHARPKTPRRGRSPACDRDSTTRHSTACRTGDSASCGADWCECRCHVKAGTP